MRSISNFPTGQNRKRGRRIPNHNNTSNANGNNGWNQPGPVWGRSAAAVVAISSPSNSSFGSSGSSGSSNESVRSLSRSPVPPSPVWGRSARVSVAATRSPRQARNAMKKAYYQQQQGVMPSRSRSPSPQSPVLMDDYRDEVTTSIPSHPLRHQQQQLLLPPQKASSSPLLSHDLCTIAEDRKISSSTLNQMAITSTADEIAKSPVLAKRRPQQHQQHQQQQPQHDYPIRRQQSTSPKFRDPYNDDSFDDSRDQDCADCWAYQKSRFQNCWPFGKHSEATRNNNNNMSRQIKEISISPRRGRTAGFPAVHRRVHVRRTSF